MKFSEIKNLSQEELRNRYAQMREEQFELKIKHSLGQVGNPLQLRRIRKDIARVVTIFNRPQNDSQGKKTSNRKIKKKKLKTKK